jgi:hypothetical protein
MSIDEFAVPRRKNLDREWAQLMSLCEHERKLRSEGGHDRLLKLIASDIVELAGRMGFSQTRIETRDFCAQREGDHIVGILRE